MHTITGWASRNSSRISLHSREETATIDPQRRHPSSEAQLPCKHLCQSLHKFTELRQETLLCNPRVESLLMESFYPLVQLEVPANSMLGIAV